MAEFPALMLWTDAFIADTTHLDATETGAYISLLIAAWRRPDCDLPDNKKLLARWARCSPRQWARIEPTIMEFFTLENDAWIQKRLRKERLRCNNLSAVRSKVGKLGAEAKWLKTKEPAMANGSGLLKQNDAIQNQNQRKKDVTTVTSKKSGPVLCPPDFQPDEKTCSDLLAEGATATILEQARLEMIDWSRGGSKRKHDWVATYRNWVRRMVKDSKPRHAPDKQSRRQAAIEETRRDLANG